MPDEYPPPVLGRCAWPTGTAGSGPSRCNRPAKADVNIRIGDIEVPQVCGIHARRREAMWPKGNTDE
jgi:hypothetical protein